MTLGRRRRWGAEGRCDRPVQKVADGDGRVAIGERLVRAEDENGNVIVGDASVIDHVQEIVVGEPVAPGALRANVDVGRAQGDFDTAVPNGTRQRSCRRSAGRRRGTGSNVDPPCCSSTVKNIRKSGCGRMVRARPLSLISSVPPGSRSAFRRSSTDGAHRLALSSRTQAPFCGTHTDRRRPPSASVRLIGPNVAQPYLNSDRQGTVDPFESALGAALLALTDTGHVHAEATRQRPNHVGLTLIPPAEGRSEHTGPTSCTPRTLERWGAVRRRSTGREGRW